MTTYLVAYGSHPGERFRATAYAARAEAIAAAAQQPAGDCALVVENAADLILSGPLLAVAFNALTGAHVARFENRETGVRRFLEALAGLPPPEPLTQGVCEMAKTTTVDGTGEKKARRLFSNDDVITVLADANPQRAGSKSHSMHEKYRSGMTVKQAVDAGITMSHIIYGARKGHIRVDPTPVAQVAA